jgi:hypothetical protein
MHDHGAGGDDGSVTYCVVLPPWLAVLARRRFRACVRGKILLYIICILLHNVSVLSCPVLSFRFCFRFCFCFAA